jgi:hypothetical protein
MADTGAPWELPYPLNTDLVRDGADAIKALAEATADGLDAAGGLVAVKHALFTGTQTASVTAGSNVAVTNLSITHTLADASNKLIISAYCGTLGSSQSFASVGMAVADDGTLIGVGDADGVRVRVASSFHLGGSGSFTNVAESLYFVYEPGDTNAHTFTVRAINVDSSTRTLYVNRRSDDSNVNNRPRGSSGFVIQEIKV